MKFTKIPYWVSALMLLAGCMASQPMHAVMMREAAPPPAVASEPFPYPIVELRGTPTDLGAQHGQALGETIRMLHEKYLKVYLGTRSNKVLALSAAKMFERLMTPAHQQENAALALAAGLDEDEAMLGQCFLDLSPMAACSTITLPAEASGDGVARFGRNLDFWSLGVADQYSTIFIVHPAAGRYGFVSIGWPGLIGVLSGMNEHGLALANMEVARLPRLPTAMPYTLLYRLVLEQCKTVDEAVSLLQRTPRQTANNLMLMDAAGNRAAVEITPDTIHVRRGLPGAALISTNHQRDQDQDTAGRCWRYDYLHGTAAASFGKLDEMQLRAMLSHVGGKNTLQSMIFEPARRVIYLSTGANSAARDFHRLDLTRYFHE